MWLDFKMTDKRIFICAGEASGDALGANIIKILKERNPNIEFSGIGGPLMENQDFKSIFAYNELAIMGIFEIIPHIRNIIKRLKQTVEAIKIFKPDIVLTIDSPGFNFRLAKRVRRLKNNSCKIIHYGAPTVWAWRPNRAKKIAKFLDHLLVLFPFEPDYFTKHNLPTTFVGHPIADRPAPKNRPEVDKKLSDESSTFHFLILPGSRQTEIKHMAPIFAQVAKILYKKYPHIKFLLPTLPHLMDDLKPLFKNLPVEFISNHQEKWDAFYKSDLALAASGTVTLELAQAQVPMIVAYKTSTLTAAIIKKLIKIPYVSLVNILCSKQIVPECLQKECEPNLIVEYLENLIKTEQNRKIQLDEFKNLIHHLKVEPDSATLITQILENSLNDSKLK